jgi:hypothetical protein
MCAVAGSWASRRPSLAPYVTVTARRERQDEAHRLGGPCCDILRTRRPGHVEHRERRAALENLPALQAR